MIWLIILLSCSSILLANSDDEENWDNSFNDQPVLEVEYPQWFKKSFLELPDDVKEALDDGKKGVIVYFGQKHCAYCQALIDKDFGQKDIETYTRRNFDVIPVNIWGSNDMVTPDGQTMTEREYALRENANFTPSLIFYNTQGKKIFMLRGYYPPYKFRAVLEYIVQDYYKEESLRDYMLRANPPPKFELADLNEESFFSMPPYALDRSQFPAKEPLLVFFEQRDCHACDVLHSQSLDHGATQELLKKFELVQLDMNAETPVITPSGEHLSAKQWAAKLELFYAPTLIAFDEQGKEIIRVDSVAHVYRLKSVLEFIVNKTYINTPNFMSWRFESLFSGNKLPKIKVNKGDIIDDFLPQGSH